MKSMDRARSPGHDVPTRAQMFQLLRQHEACIRSWTCTLAEDTGNADRCGHSDTTSISCVSMVQSGGVSRPRESALFCLAFAGTGCWLVVKTVPLRDGTAIEEAPDGAVNMAAIDVPTQISSSPGSRRHMITFASSSARESFTTAVRAALALKSDSTDDCIEADTVTRVRFRAIKKAVLRKGFERDSEVCGALQPGDMVRVEERRDLDSTVRLRCERGWTSATGKDGAVLLLEEGNDTYLQATKDATVRAECGRDSAKVGMLAAGSVIEVLERADEIEGDEASAEGKRTRVRYSLGWVSVFGASGTELLMRTDFSSLTRLNLSSTPEAQFRWLAFYEQEPTPSGDMQVWIICRVDDQKLQQRSQMQLSPQDRFRKAVQAMASSPRGTPRSRARTLVSQGPRPGSTPRGSPRLCPTPAQHKGATWYCLGVRTSGRGMYTVWRTTAQLQGLVKSLGNELGLSVPFIERFVCVTGAKEEAVGRAFVQCLNDQVMIRRCNCTQQFLRAEWLGLTPAQPILRLNTGKATPEPEPQPQQAMPDMNSLHCAIKKAVLRKGFERDSEVCGALQPGDMVRVEERRDLDSTVRLRCERGWTSATGKDGAVLLLEEGNDTYLQATKDATVRAECGRDSAKVGMLAAGSVIEVLERADEIEGDEASAEGKRTRVRYSLGWVSVFGASGTELLMRTDFQSVKSRIKLSPKQRLQWAVAQTIERESVTLDSEPNDEACDDEDEIPTIDDEKPLHFIDPLIETLVVDVMLESERRPVLGHTVDFATDELLADEPNYIDRLGNNVELGTDKQIACPDGWRWVHLWAVEKEVVRACDAEGWSYWKRMSAFDSVLANKGEPKNTGTTFVRRRVHVRVRQNLAWRTAPLSPDDTEAVLALWREQQSDATSELCKQLEKQVLGRATVSESPGRPSGNTTFVQAVNVSEPTQSAELVSPRYQVIECHVELRQEADAESEICGCLQRGDIVTVLDKRGSGSSLRLHCGEKGWVSAYGSGGRALLLQEQSAGEYLRALAPVSVRAEHQWDSATCGTLPQHSVIDVLERKLEGAGEQAIDDESTDERVRMRFSGGWVTLMNAGKTPPTAASRALASLLLALSLPFPLSSICSQCWRQRRRSTVGDRSIWPFRSSY